MCTFTFSHECLNGFVHAIYKQGKLSWAFDANTKGTLWDTSNEKVSFCDKLFKPSAVLTVTRGSNGLNYGSTSHFLQINSHI